MSGLPTELNALTTLADGSIRCTVSPAESVHPTERVGGALGAMTRGFVTSMTTLPAKWFGPAQLERARDLHSETRDHDHLAPLSRVGEGAGRPVRPDLLLPGNQALALRGPRPQPHGVPRGDEPDAQRFRNLSRSENSHLHGRPRGLKQPGLHNGPRACYPDAIERMYHRWVRVGRLPCRRS